VVNGILCVEHKIVDDQLHADNYGIQIKLYVIPLHQQQRRS